MEEPSTRRANRIQTLAPGCLSQGCGGDLQSAEKRTVHSLEKNFSTFKPALYRPGVRHDAMVCKDWESGFRRNHASCDCFSANSRTLGMRAIEAPAGEFF